MEYSMLVLKSRSYCSCSVDRNAVSATMEVRPYWVPFFHLSSAFDQRKVRRFLLAFSWIAGLICGIGLCHAAGPSFVSWMRGVCECPVSIGRLTAFTILPFLLSALAVYTSHPGLLFGLAFARAASLSFVCSAVSLGWGSSGWLVRWLLCFGGLLTAPVLYGYWLRHIGRHRPFSLWETVLLLSAAGILGSCHYFTIAPLLARVIHS